MSSTDQLWERNDIRLIGVRALRMVVPTLIVAVALVGLYSTLGRVGQIVILTFAVYYTWTRINQLFYTYHSVQWKVTRDELILKRGIFFINYTHIPLTNVIGISRHQGRYERLLGVYRIIIETKIAQGVNFTFDAVRHSSYLEEVDQLLSTRSPTLQSIDRPSRKLASPSDDEAVLKTDHVARITPKRLLAISFTYGKYLLFFPLAAGLLSRVTSTDMLNIVSDAGSWLQRTNPMLATVAGISFIALTVSYGYVVCLLMYGNLSVSGRDGILRVERGVFTRWNETIEAENVDTLRIRQNVVMRLSGLYDLRATVRGSAEEGRERIISPGLTRNEINRLLKENLNSFSLEDYKAEKPSFCGFAFRLICHIIMISSLLLFSVYSIDLRVDVAYILAAIIGLFILNKCYVLLLYSPSHSRLSISQGFISRSTWMVPNSSICSINTTRFALLPAAQRLRIVFRSGGTIPKKKIAYIASTKVSIVEGIG